MTPKTDIEAAEVFTKIFVDTVWPKLKELEVDQATYIPDHDFGADGKTRLSERQKSYRDGFLYGADFLLKQIIAHQRGENG